MEPKQDPVNITAIHNLINDFRDYITEQLNIYTESVRNEFQLLREKRNRDLTNIYQSIEEIQNDQTMNFETLRDTINEIIVQHENVAAPPAQPARPRRDIPEPSNVRKAQVQTFLEQRLDTNAIEADEVCQFLDRLVLQMCQEFREGNHL